MKLTRDVKNVLISMLQKKLKSDTPKAQNFETADEGAINRQIDAIVELLKKNPRKYFDLEVIYDNDGFGGGFMDGVPLNDAFDADVKKIVKANPTSCDRDEQDEDENEVFFAALDFTLYNVPKKVRARYQKLADAIDMNVIAAEGKDLYELIKRA